MLQKYVWHKNGRGLFPRTFLGLLLVILLFFGGNLTLHAPYMGVIFPPVLDIGSTNLMRAPER